MVTDDRSAASQAPAAPYAIKNASDLRDHLSKVELALAGLNRGTADDAANVVRLIDAIEKALPRLEAQFGIDLKSERGRLQLLENRLRSNAGTLVKRAGASRLRQLRLEASPSADDWWWSLDLAVAAQRRQQVRALGVKVAIAVAVLVVLGVVYELFLAPKAKPATAGDRKSSGQTYLQQGNLDGALTEYRGALDLAPTDAEAAAAIAAILNRLGRADEAAAAVTQAKGLAASEAEYYADLAMTYYYMSSQGMLDAKAEAEQAANQAIAADPGSAKAYLALGGVYELQDKVGEAIEALNTAASLTDDVAIQAAIKVRTAMLSQRVSGMLPTSESETPEPE